MVTLDNSLWKRWPRAVHLLLMLLVMFAVGTGVLGLPSAVHAQGTPPTLKVPQPPAIYGDVFYDANQNGVYDWPDESGIGNIRVILRVQGQTSIVAETRTDEYGFYTFDNLPYLAVYTVVVDPLHEIYYVPTTAKSADVLLGPDTVAKLAFGFVAEIVYMPSLFGGGPAAAAAE